MDSDPEKTTKLKAAIVDAGNVFSTIWIRCSVSATNGSNWIILEGRRGLLLPFRFFLVGLYLTYEILK